MKHLVIILLTLSTFSVKAQQTSVTGKLIDTVGKQKLESASISLLEAGDSSLEQFTLSKLDGSFELKNVPIGNYFLQIVFQGFNTYTKRISINKDEPLLRLGNIYLKQQIENLNEVTVTQSPIIIKKIR